MSVHVLQVHVQPQIEVSVCDVAAIDDVLHIPHLTIKRLSQLGETCSHPPDLAVRVTRVGIWYTTEEEQPRALQLRDGA
jgi:hypothetical protein